ncbi:MAG: phosphatidate cytidylyltransferase [Acidobacteriota bacterium]|nr:phosphatidate cytidylyltransferase [Acidobacteriota bacterium]
MSTRQAGTRILTGLAAASVAILAVGLLSSEAVLWVCVALFAGIAFEYSGLVRAIAPGSSAVAFLVVVPLTTSAWVLLGEDAVRPLWMLALCPLILAVAAFRGAGDPAGAVRALGLWSFGVPYLALPVWAIYELHRLGPRRLLVLLASVWLNDTAAYFVGKSLGRRKLAPRLSPAKTIEGSVAGLVSAGLVGYVGAGWLDSESPLLFAALILLAGVAAQCGDLVESLLKRAAGVKDSGSILPGHGGLLDRMDAIILAAPVFYVLLATVGGPAIGD